MASRIQTWLWRGVAPALLLSATYCLVQWGDSSSPDHAGAATSGRYSAASDASEEGPTGPSAPASPGQARPVALTIPAIGVSTRLISLGLNSDGTVEVPTDPALAGWYRFGTRPGALGSAVVLGHVDSVSGPAVFFRLRNLTPGELVGVRTAAGGSEWFRVQSVRVYDNDHFPAQRVYGGKDGRTLNLVTCGGEYDAERGGYQANVVVHARWVRTGAS